MKANELMIGDLVLYQGNPNRVYRILPDTVPFADAGRMKEDLVHIVWNDTHDQVNVNNLEPIPLTPEILEKNGFVYNAIPFADGWEQFGLTLYRGGNGFRINCGINVSLIIDSVHQLQHAIRLCGIEKEIKI